MVSSAGVGLRTARLFWMQNLPNYNRINDRFDYPCTTIWQYYYYIISIITNNSFTLCSGFTPTTSRVTTIPSRQQPTTGFSRVSPSPTLLLCLVYLLLIVQLVDNQHQQQLRSHQRLLLHQVVQEVHQRSVLVHTQRLFVLCQ